MRKQLDKAKNKLYDVRFSDEHKVTRKFFGKGFKAMICIVAGIFLILLAISLQKQKETKESVPTKYSQIEYTNVQKGEDAITKALSKGQKVTLILHRKGCPACESVEKLITKRVSTMKKSNPKRKYIVLDVKKMNNDQLNYIALRMPEILDSDNKIPTPTVINLSPSASKEYWVTTDYSVLAKPSQINRVFNRSEIK